MPLRAAALVPVVRGIETKVNTDGEGQNPTIQLQPWSPSLGGLRLSVCRQPHVHVAVGLQPWSPSLGGLRPIATTPDAINPG